MPKKRKQQYENDYSSIDTKDLIHKKPKKSSNMDASGFGKTKKTALQQHQDLIYNYIKYYGGSLKDLAPDPANFKTDLDIVHENAQFVWDDDVEDKDRSWNERVAKNYWDKLNKEYVIADLSRYKEKQYAFRWRTEKEVIDGCGQFTCANRKCKDHKSEVVDLEGLNSFEVMFDYIEKGEKKSTLVKVRVCEKCEKKLNFHWQHKLIKKQKKQAKKEAEKLRRKRECSGSTKKEEWIGKDEYIDLDDDEIKKSDDVVFIKKEEVKKEAIVLSSDEGDTSGLEEIQDRKRSRSRSRDRGSSRDPWSSSRDRDDRGYRDDRSRHDRYRDDRYRDDRYRDHRYRDDRYREDRYREDRYRDDRDRYYARDESRDRDQDRRPDERSSRDAEFPDRSRRRSNEFPDRGSRQDDFPGRSRRLDRADRKSSKQSKKKSSKSKNNNNNNSDDDVQDLNKIWEIDGTREKTMDEKRDDQFDDYLNSLLA